MATVHRPQRWTACLCPITPGALFGNPRAATRPLETPASVVIPSRASPFRHGPCSEARGRARDLGVRCGSVFMNVDTPPLSAPSVRASHLHLPDDRMDRGGCAPVQLRGAWGPAHVGSPSWNGQRTRMAARTSRPRSTSFDLDRAAFVRAASASRLPVPEWTPPPYRELDAGERTTRSTRLTGTALAREPEAMLGATGGPPRRIERLRRPGGTVHPGSRNLRSANA